MIARIVIALLLPACALAQPGVTTREYRSDDGSRVLVQSLVIDAPVEAVWQVFTTSEGWESWAVPFARIDFRVDGVIETSYDPEATPGAAGNIRNRILSYLPYRMLAIQATQAPPDFPHADLLPSLHSVFEFEPAAPGRTRVTVSGVGYREGEGYDALLGFFRQGNAWTFERLVRRFEEGPVDWSESAPSRDD